MTKCEEFDCLITWKDALTECSICKRQICTVFHMHYNKPMIPTTTDWKSVCNQCNKLFLCVQDNLHQYALFLKGFKKHCTNVYYCTKVWDAEHFNPQGVFRDVKSEPSAAEEEGVYKRKRDEKKKPRKTRKNKHSGQIPYNYMHAKFEETYLEKPACFFYQVISNMDEDQGKQQYILNEFYSKYGIVKPDQIAQLQDPKICLLFFCFLELYPTRSGNETFDLFAQSLNDYDNDEMNDMFDRFESSYQSEWHLYWISNEMPICQKQWLYLYFKQQTSIAKR